MKLKLSTLMILIVLGVSINSANAQSGVGTKEITQSEYFKLVADFNNISEWKFKGDKPVVIDFYATWCGPCKSLAPILNDLAKEYAGKVDFYKIDVDKNREISSKYAIRSVPTLLFIPVTGKPTLVTGALPKAELKEQVDLISL